MVFHYDPHPLIQVDRDGEINMCDNGVNKIKEFTEQSISVVVFLGMSEKQHRSAVNSILNVQEEILPFESSYEGIVYLGYLALEDKDTETVVIVLDILEGHKHKLKTHDTSLLFLGILLSSIFVYFHDGEFNSSSNDKLEPLNSLIDGISNDLKTKEDEENEDNDLLVLKELLPSFCWILDNNSSMKLNLNASLTTSLSKASSLGLFNRASSSIYQVLENESIKKKKKLLNHTINSNLLISLLRSYINNLNNDLLPDVHGAWNEIVEDLSKKIKEEALETYKECMKESIQEIPLISEERLLSDHKEVSLLSLDLFHNGAIYKGVSRRKVKQQLKKEMNELYKEQLDKLKGKSREYCQEIGYKLLERFHFNSFKELKECIQDFLFNYEEQAKGPERNHVLVDSLFNQILEKIEEYDKTMMKSIHEETLKEEIKRLEEDYQLKGNQLNKQYQEKEILLKQTIQKEQEIFQKLAQVTQNRLLGGENDIKRIKEDLKNTKNILLEKEEQNILLKQSEKELQIQSQSLQERVKHLNEHLIEEQQLRENSYLVLSETIRSAEEKEKELEKQIKVNQEEFLQKEELYKAEIQLKTQQLQKTTEEKDELQKRLNDFFLKVTSLPVTMQENFFCIPVSSNEDLVFADVLSSYMS